MIPTAVETPNASKNELSVITALIPYGKKFEIKVAKPHPDRNPNRPPLRVKMIASNRNWFIILRGVAPIAKRIPIS